MLVNIPLRLGMLYHMGLTDPVKMVRLKNNLLKLRYSLGI